MYKKSQHTLFFYAKYATWLNNWSIIRSPSRSLDFSVLENCVRQPAWDKQLCHGKEVNQITWFVNRCKSALDISFAGWGMGHSTEHCLSTLSYRCVCLINHSQTRLQGLKKNEDIYIGTFQAFLYLCMQIKVHTGWIEYWISSLPFPRTDVIDRGGFGRWNLELIHESHQIGQTLIFSGQYVVLVTIKNDFRVDSQGLEPIQTKFWYFEQILGYKIRIVLRT